MRLLEFGRKSQTGNMPLLQIDDYNKLFSQTTLLSKHIPLFETDKTITPPLWSLPLRVSVPR